MIRIIGPNEASTDASLRQDGYCFRSFSGIPPMAGERKNTILGVCASVLLPREAGPQDDEKFAILRTKGFLDTLMTRVILLASPILKTSTPPIEAHAFASAIAVLF